MISTPADFKLARRKTAELADPLLGDHLPPHSVEAEQGVLGCILLSPGECLEKCFAARLVPASFYDLRHRAVFEAVLALYDANNGIDLLLLSQHLRECSQIESVGGLPYLASLPDYVPSAANLGHYLDKVMEKAKARRLVGAGTDLIVRAREWNGDVEELQALENQITEAFKAGSSSPLRQLLADRRLDFDRKPPAPDPVFTLTGTTICTPGNLATINAQAKAGKTALVGAMLSATMKPLGVQVDTLGFDSRNPLGFGVLHFDSEQSPFDHFNQIARAVTRAGVAAPPDWLRSYCLTGLPCREAWEAVKLAVADAAQAHHGIHSIHIDGVADLVSDVNDAAECNAFVADLHALAIKSCCPIVGVIHFNPGSEKTRGHLGSQMERKSETNLRLEKDGEATLVYSEKQRGAPILKDTGPRFRWSSEAGMHVTCASARSEKQEARRANLRCQRDDVFGNHPSMRFGAMVSGLQEAFKVSARTAERRVAEWRQFGLVEELVAKLWVKVG